MKAHEQMELLKKDKKDIVSGANVGMTNSFLKPIDYAVDLLVRSHPTLRDYTNQVGCSEVDTEYYLYPAKKERLPLMDEILLKNSKKEKDVTLVSSLTKTVGGAFVNDLNVSIHELPGNFGVRVIETMPTNIRAVFIDQRNNIGLEYKCDYRISEVPNMLGRPDENDYLTDEESDEGADFEVKVPELDNLLDQFEKGDGIIAQLDEKEKEFVKDEIANGFSPPKNHDIKDQKGGNVTMLDANISKQR